MELSRKEKIKVLKRLDNEMESLKTLRELLEMKDPLFISVSSGVNFTKQVVFKKEDPVMQEMKKAILGVVDLTEPIVEKMISEYLK